MPRPFIRLICASALLAGGVPAMAAPTSPMHLGGDVFVEHLQPGTGGRGARVLEHADTLHPGDRLVFVVSWSGGDARTLTLTNPVPHSVAWLPATAEDTTEVSVDGGHSWGNLANLMVRDGAAWRRALPGDVTHLRWRVPGGTGQITYRGVVR